MSKKNDFGTMEKQTIRDQIKEMLGIPEQEYDLEPELRGTMEHDDVIIEKWVWTSEPGSRVPSLLYLPKHHNGLVPGVVIANGHGGSKNALTNQYCGQLYAKSGIACLLHDTIGEEERHSNGEKGTRAHDDHQADREAASLGRLMFGKMTYDVLRALDFISLHDRVNAESIAVVGNSLGGTISQWVTALDPRLQASIISGWGIGDYSTISGKSCTRVPSINLQNICRWDTLLAIAAPNCSTLIMNGLKDEVIDQDESGLTWQETTENYQQALKVYENKGVPEKLKLWFDEEGGHRGYHMHQDGLSWLLTHLHGSTYDEEYVQSLPDVTFGEWCERHGIPGRKQTASMYWFNRHHRGALLTDMDIQPIAEAELKCLSAEEVGAPQYTLEGWLDMIK